MHGFQAERSGTKHVRRKQRWEEGERSNTGKRFNEDVLADIQSRLRIITGSADRWLRENTPLTFTQLKSVTVGGKLWRPRSRELSEQHAERLLWNQSLNMRLWCTKSFYQTEPAARFNYLSAYLKRVITDRIRRRIIKGKWDFIEEQSLGVTARTKVKKWRS